MDDPPRGAMRDLAMQIHDSLGVLVLGFAALRVARYAVAPPPQVQGAAWQRLAAAGTHVALMLPTIGLPLSGLLDYRARGRAVTVFGGLRLPAPFDMPGGRVWGEAHEALANLLLAAIALHVEAALWHQLVRQNGGLSRMLVMPCRRPGSPPAS